MRPRAGAAAAVAAIAVFGIVFLHGATTAEERPDSSATAVAPPTAAPADSSRGPSHPDSTATPAYPGNVESAGAAFVAASKPSLASLVLELLDARRDGATTVRRQWQGRRPVAMLRLPLAGDAFDRPMILTAGFGDDPWRPSSTDRTPIDGLRLRFGVPNASATIATPPPPEGDPFLVDGWGRMDGPGAPKAGTSGLGDASGPELWWRRPLLDPAASTEPTSSALYYEKGGGGVERTGVRFAAPAFARGIAAAYTRRATDGEGAFFRALESRYVVAAGLPSVAGVRGWFEGAIAQRQFDGAIPDPLLDRVLAGGAEGDRRHVALHARGEAPRVTWTMEARAARVRHTQIDFDAARERWDEPSWSLRGDASWQPSPGWTWRLAAETTDRTLRSDLGPASGAAGPLDASFATHRREGRATASVRRERPGAGGAGPIWGADLGYDAREGGPALVEARVSASVRQRRSVASLGLESVPERPTWEDRLTPAHDRIFADVVVLPKPVHASVESDASLAPRRLTGFAGRAAWEPNRRLRLRASASAHYVTDDFGWDLVRTETADTLFLLERARRRGDGWTGHGSLGIEFEAAHLAARILGWARAGSRALSPHAGSPPRAGMDASVDLKATFFQGDLPLRLGAAAHLDGVRDGAIRAPAIATLDASLRADFTEAGLFFRIEDLLDRRPPSGVYDIATDAGAPLPGRRFRFGVVWHLLD